MNTRLMSLCSLAAALTVSASNSLSAANQDPVPVSQAAPVYSHELRASGVEGEVVVRFTITSTGEVANPVVVSSTNQLLDYPTLAAVRKWKFTPAMKDGVAVNVKAVQPVAFMIPELHPAEARLITKNAHPATPEKSHSSFD
jgi:TonB family protein